GCTITKTWLDDQAKNRPIEIKLDLFRAIKGGDEKKVGTFKVTEKDDWKLAIEQLPSFDKDGQAYIYAVKEHGVKGYETTINGFDITNLRIGVTTVAGAKTWKGDRKSDRPEAIQVHLLQNGKEIVADGKSTSTLTTTVTDKNGKTVPNVDVVFDAEKGSFPEGSTATTDEDGKARITFKSDKIED